MDNKYFGNYVGICIQNNDPEHRGRIKIFVPHISATLYENWNQDANKLDKNFIFPDKATNPDLDKVIEDLKDILPWADCASPLFGGSSSGKYNAFTRKGTTSESSHWEDDELVDGVRPLQNYTGENKYSDAFSNATLFGPVERSMVTNLDDLAVKNDEPIFETKNRFTNPYAHQYEPSNYSNLARGMFTIPNVGAHVWVFFMGGNPIYPVYFAVSYNKEDWERIYNLSKETGETFNSVDYPSKYENVDKFSDNLELDDESKTFRSKTVYNSNKHTIELVDTDNREILKMTHFSGSFKEFTNYANIELATNNDQKMVIGDQFLTVKKNQSIYVANNREIIIAGDSFRTVGVATTEQILNVVKILKDVHQYKQLFDVNRTPYSGYGTSPLQEMGSINDFAFCPTCGGQGYAPNSNLTIQTYFSGNIVPDWSTITDCEETLDPNWNITFINYESIVNQLTTTLNSIGGQVGFYLGDRCDSCMRSKDGFTTGYSPSTKNGFWERDNKKNNISKLILDKTEALYNAEHILGEGDEIVEITKNKVETIGLVMNDMDPYRIDPIGKLEFNGVYTALEGTYPTYKASQLIEYVDVDDVPGGDYNLTVSNRYKLLVGAKGINIKTFGPIDMFGPIVNIAGEQVNIMSKGEVTIGGGERTIIKGRQIVLQPDPTNSEVVTTGDDSAIVQPPGTSVAVSGNMHVQGNTILNGGTFIEGELGILHVTAPWEWHLTEPAKPIKTTTAIEYCSGDQVSHVHYIMPHQHYFQNLPIDFYPSKEYVRFAMNRINTTDTQVTSARSLMITTSADALSGDQMVFNNPWHQGSSNTYVVTGE